MQLLAAAEADIGKIAAMTGTRESDHDGPSKNSGPAVAFRRLSNRCGPDAGNLGLLSDQPWRFGLLFHLRTASNGVWCSRLPFEGQRCLGILGGIQLYVRIGFLGSWAQRVATVAPPRWTNCARARFLYPVDPTWPVALISKDATLRWLRTRALSEFCRHRRRIRGPRGGDCRSAAPRAHQTRNKVGSERLAALWQYARGTALRAAYPAEFRECPQAASRMDISHG